MEISVARATWQGEVLAESEDIIYVEGNAYFPAASLRRELVEDSDHHTFCLWKGTASYYHALVRGERNENAVWYYPRPFPMARMVAGRVAFWHGVQIEDEAA